MPVALSDEAIEQIRLHYENEQFGPWEFARVMETIKVQRDALKLLLSFYQRDPLRLVAMADPIRVATLDEIHRSCSIPKDAVQ